jgi:miniconductance mechanosensitive channel
MQHSHIVAKKEKETEMTYQDIQQWAGLNPVLAPWVLGTVAVVVGLVLYLVTRLLIARSLVYLAGRTANKYDDIIVAKLRPYRFAWIAPMLAIYYFAGLLPDSAELIRDFVLFLIAWLVIITVNSLLNGVNAIYEASRFYRGDSIQVYIDLIKILLLLVGIVLSISWFTGKSPLVLLSGLGALMAVLLLVFHDTILSFVAGLQIQSNDLVNEGDWIEVPSYDADGEVLNISLHSVKVQNWDMTITVIPTHKLVETPYKNWRGMEEAGGRRIKRSIHLDVTSVRFCDEEMIGHLREIDLIKEYVETELAELEQWNREHNVNPRSPVNGRQLTNLNAFREYACAYLKSRPDLHQDKMTLLVRQLEPGPSGLPIEIYAFTRTVDWIEYESIQAEILGHLMAAVPEFGLRVFQEPAGTDFQAMLRTR